VFTATAYLRYIADHPWIIALVLIAFGIITTFRGMEFFNWVVSVLTGGIAFTASMLLFSAFGMVDYLDPVAAEGSLVMSVLSIVLAIIIAAFVGYFFYNFADEIGVLTIGGIGGFFIGVTLYNTALFWSDNFYVLLTVTLVSILFFASLAFKYKDEIMIYGTALIGSYSFIRGVSLFAGHFPSEILTYS